MVFELKIKIKGSAKPPIWRSIQVNNNITFDDLHEIIQCIFEWNNSHLYCFSPKAWSAPFIKIPEIDDYFEEPVSPISHFPNGQYFDASKMKLYHYFEEEKAKINYIYDFGDNWQHEIELKKILPGKTLYPTLIGGKGLAPYEDCGGIWGFYNLIEAVNNPKHPEHEDMRDWLDIEKGSIIDPNEKVEIEEINQYLRGL